MLIGKKVVFLQSLSRDRKWLQEKQCKTVPISKFGIISMKEDGAFMLSLVVYAIGSRLGISSGVRYVPFRPFLHRFAETPISTDMSTLPHAFSFL